MGSDEKNYGGERRMWF